MQTKNQCNKRRIDGRLVAMISIMPQHRHDRDSQHASRTCIPTISLESLSSANQIHCLLCLSPTKDPISSHSTVKHPFFEISICWGTCSYFWLIYCCSQGSEISVTLEIPAIGIFSKSNLSTISHNFCGILLLVVLNV